MRIRYYINRIIKKISRIDKCKVVFMSYNGQFSDSPKYVYYEMKRIAPELEYIWLINSKKVCTLPEGVKYYIYGTKEAEDTYYTAHIIVDNVFGNNESYLRGTRFFEKFKFAFLTWLNYKKNQHLYSTWHGSPFKRMGADLIDSNIIDFSRPNLTIILNDGYALDILKRLTFSRINYKVMSSPRNDILSIKDREYVDSIKIKLGIPINKKVAVFAPTFRAKKDIDEKDVKRSGINQIEMIDFDRLFSVLKERFNGEWVFVCRFHYHVSDMVDWETIEKKYGGKVINGNKSDEMGEYLLCSDILISDVSSCLIDYSSTNKPAFLYFPDIDYYLKEERGALYYDLEKMPFKLAKNSDELYDSIKSFDEDRYLKELDEFRKDIRFEYDSKSSPKMAEFILKDSGIEIKEEVE